jgi:hypothetical protein
MLSLGSRGEGGWGCGSLLRVAKHFCFKNYKFITFLSRTNRNKIISTENIELHHNFPSKISVRSSEGRSNEDKERREKGKGKEEKGMRRRRRGRRRRSRRTFFSRTKYHWFDTNILWRCHPFSELPYWSSFSHVARGTSFTNMPHRPAKSTKKQGVAKQQPNAGRIQKTTQKATRGPQSGLQKVVDAVEQASLVTKSVRREAPQKKTKPLVEV